MTPRRPIHSEKPYKRKGAPVPTKRHKRVRHYYARTLQDELADIGALMDKAIRDIERIGKAEIERLGKANAAMRRL